MKVKVFMLIINMKMLNGFNHKLGAYKSLGN